MLSTFHASSNHVIDHDTHTGNDWKSHYILTWVVESGMEAIKLTLKIVPEENSASP